MRLLTGGGGKAVLPCLQGDYRLEPDLLFLGLRVIAPICPDSVSASFLADWRAKEPKNYFFPSYPRRRVSILFNAWQDSRSIAE